MVIKHLMVFDSDDENSKYEFLVEKREKQPKKKRFYRYKQKVIVDDTGQNQFEEQEIDKSRKREPTKYNLFVRMNYREVK
jgi:hypothetical protein